MIRAGLQPTEIIAIFEACRAVSPVNYEVFGEAARDGRAMSPGCSRTGETIPLQPNYEVFGELHA